VNPDGEAVFDSVMRTVSPDAAWLPTLAAPAIPNSTRSVVSEPTLAAAEVPETAEPMTGSSRTAFGLATSPPVRPRVHVRNGGPGVVDAWTLRLASSNTPMDRLFTTRIGGERLTRHAQHVLPQPVRFDPVIYAM
jgi:hypothetical protein